MSDIHEPPDEHTHALRDALADAIPDPTATERAHMDDAVFAALDARSAPSGVQRGGGTSCEAEPVAIRPGARRKASPRSRGKRALPYFVAAAAIAVVLSVGISIIASSLQQGPTSDTASVEFSVDSTSGDKSNDAGSPRSGSDPTASGSASTPLSGAPPAPAAERSGAPGGVPELFLANVAFGTEADLVGLAKRAPLATVSPDAARTELSSTARGLPAVADLPACLAALPPDFVPMKVETGTWQGADVFYVSGSPVGGKVSVYVIARTSCTPVTSIALN